MFKSFETKSKVVYSKDPDEQLQSFLNGGNNINNIKVVNCGDTWGVYSIKVDGIDYEILSNGHIEIPSTNNLFEIDIIHTPSKSTSKRMEKLFNSYEEKINNILTRHGVMDYDIWRMMTHLSISEEGDFIFNDRVDYITMIQHYTPFINIKRIDNSSRS